MEHGSLLSEGPEPTAVCPPMPLLKWDLARWGRGSQVGALLDESNSRQPGEEPLTASHAFFNNNKTFKLHDEGSLSRLHQAMAKDFKNLKANCIIERCDTKLIRLFLDLDIEHESVTYENVRDEWLGPIASAVLQCTGLERCIVGVAIAPPKMKNGKTKTGVHLNFPDILLPLREQVEEGKSIFPFQVVVEAVKHMLDTHSGVTDLDWNTVVDSSLYHERKGLRMLFQSKLENCDTCGNKWKELNNGAFLCTEKNKSWSRCSCSSHAAFALWKASELSKVDHCPPLHACDGLRLWSVNRLYVPVDVFTCTLQGTGTQTLATCVRDIPLLLRSLPFGESLNQWIRADVFDLESVIEFFSIRNVDRAATATIEYNGCTTIPEWVKLYVKVQQNNAAGRGANGGNARGDRAPRVQNPDIDPAIKVFYENFFEKYQSVVSEELNAGQPLGARKVELVQSDAGSKAIHYSTNSMDPLSKFCALKGVSHHSNRNYFHLECCTRDNATQIYLTHKCYSERCKHQERKFKVTLKACTPLRERGTSMASEDDRTIFIEPGEIIAIKTHLQNAVTANRDETPAVAAVAAVGMGQTHESDDFIHADTTERNVIHSRAAYVNDLEWAMANHGVTQNSPMYSMLERYQSTGVFDDLYNQQAPKVKKPGRPKNQSRRANDESVDSFDDAGGEVGESNNDDQENLTYRQFMESRMGPDYNPTDKEVDRHLRHTKRFWNARHNYNSANEEPYHILGFGFPDGKFSVDVQRNAEDQKPWLRTFFKRRTPPVASIKIKKLK